jgi:HD-like signal output (HDOD) protein
MSTLALPDQEQEIRKRIDACPKLASLQSNNRALSDLVKSDFSVTSQIAEIIRRDPSLSARLLRMVNSVYFSLSARVNNIEEAVFFLGLRQIRELSMATPVIEELERLKAATTTPLPWKELWSHSIATAMLTREILHTTSLSIDDDTDYLVGLLHNVGKVVMANACPKDLETVSKARHKTIADVCEMERKLVCWDHAQIGAYYLERHQLAEEIVFAVKYHNNPTEAPRHGLFAAAVQVADTLVRHSGISGGFEKIDSITAESWLKLDGWKILYGDNPDDWAIPRSHISSAMNRLPAMLSGLT